jgi:hypothetical protein
MTRYLVVANQTLGAEPLLERVRACAREGDCRFHLVVPATHPKGVWTEGKVRAEAQQRLDEALARFREIGVPVDGEVGDTSPVLAVKDAMLAHTFDAIIVSTLAPGVSRWLRQDLPHRLERISGLPVIHVTEAFQNA